MKIQNYKAATIYATASILANFTAAIMESLEKHPVYKQVTPFFKSDKTRLYFQFCIRNEIEKFILQYVSKNIANINSSKSDAAFKEKSKVWLPAKGIFLLLREIWPHDEVTIEKSRIKDIFYFVLLVRDYLKESLHRNATIIFNFINRLACRYDLSNFDRSKSFIAVRYNEGVNFKRRSDIVWLEGDNIDKSRVIICLDDEISLMRKFKCFYYLNLDRLIEIEEAGLQWVGIPVSGILVNMRSNGWVPSVSYRLPEWLKDVKRKKTDDIGKWIISTTEKLLSEVELWKTFYETFNIKIFFESGEGSAKYIAQGIAFDILDKDNGIIAGKQRSDIGETPKAMTGYYTKDIFFTWNYRFKDYLTPKFNIVKAQIIAGYPNDRCFDIISDELKYIQKQLKNNGAVFIIALFDTGCGTGVNWIPVPVISGFYRYFLNWVLEDESLGIVIKSKKPYILNKMPDVMMLLESAKKTGRCVKLENELGRMPSDASKIADFAVGAGIASSITEAVLAGCKGLRYLKGYPMWHEYYKWGYEKLVFDDLDRMMNALKSYKADRNSNPDLGNWTPYLDLLDPFRDGRAGERMGTYLKWCLEGFDAGMNRDDVIKLANGKYAGRWGEDKVISPRGI